MIPFSARLALILICAGTVSVCEAGDQISGQRSKELDDAFNFASKAVVRVMITPEKGSVKQGTAVLLKLNKENNHTYGYFVTCAHVIAAAMQPIEIYQPVQNNASAIVNAVEPDQPVKILVDADHDLVILRVPLQAPDGMVEIELEPKLPEQRGTAYGFGYGVFAPENLHSVTMQVGTAVSAFYYVTPEAKNKDWLILQATRERFASGMSGGPLLAKSQEGTYRLAGVMFATDDKGAELTIPAQYIVPSLEQAINKNDGLEDFSPDTTRKIKVPFQSELQERFGQSGYRDQVEWAGLGSWIEAFDSAFGFRERFQEILIDDSTQTGKEATDALSLRIHPETVREGERVEIWVNGFKDQIPHNGQVDPWKIPLGQYLVGGDNLLTVRKVARPHAGSAIDVNDLFRTNPLTFTLATATRPPYTIGRSLPALVQNYAIYVTIRRPEDNRSQFLLPNEHFRLAVRVDAVERFLNETPFLLPIAEQLAGVDGKTAALAKMDVVFAAPAQNDSKGWRPDQFVRLDLRSSQTIDVSVRGSMANLASDIAGIQLAFDDPKKSLPFEFRSRLHFVRESAGPFHVTMRATAASSDGDFKVPILAGGGVRVQADLAGLLTEISLQLINNRFLKPEEPRLLVRERLGRLLAEVGGSGEGLNTSVELRRAFVTSIDGRPWLIVTLGLPKAVKNGPDLALVPTMPEERIVDLVGRKVPGILATEFAQLGRTRIDTAAPPSSSTIDELAFWLTPPKAWWDYPKTIDPLADRDRSSRPADGMSRAWKRLLRDSDRAIRIRIGAKDVIGLLSDLSPAITWKAPASDQVLTLTGERGSIAFDKADSVLVDELELPTQKVKLIGVEATQLRATWEGDVAVKFSGRLTAKEIQIGGPDRRLTDVVGEISIVLPTRTSEPAVLELSAPSAKVRFPGVDFGVQAEKGAWTLKLGSDGKLTGKLKIDLDNAAGRAEFDFQPNRVELIAVDIDLSRINAVKDQINKAIKGIAPDIDTDLDKLRVDSAANRLTIGLTLKKRVVVDLKVKKFDETVKLPINEQINLRQALANKKIAWNVSVFGRQIKVADFDLPLDKIRDAVKLDEILGKD